MHRISHKKAIYTLNDGSGWAKSLGWGLTCIHMHPLPPFSRKMASFPCLKFKKKCICKTENRVSRSRLVSGKDGEKLNVELDRSGTPWDSVPWGGAVDGWLHWSFCPDGVIWGDMELSACIKCLFLFFFSALNFQRLGLKVWYLDWKLLSV